MNSSQSPFRKDRFRREVLTKEITNRPPTDLAFLFVSLTRSYGVKRIENAVRNSYPRDVATKIITGIKSVLVLEPVKKKYYAGADIENLRAKHLHEKTDAERAVVCCFVESASAMERFQLPDGHREALRIVQRFHADGRVRDTCECAPWLLGGASAG